MTLHRKNPEPETAAWEGSTTVSHSVIISRNSVIWWWGGNTALWLAWIISWPINMDWAHATVPITLANHSAAFPHDNHIKLRNVATKPRCEW